ncbi:MAG: glycosyltransferase family 4 protein [Nitrosomonas sp.]|nr:glycosyltransferase family 4 protein [Nitrosomonas sp.]
MKILTISNLYPPNAVGGYEVLCFEVMQALARKGYEIAVLTSNYGNKHVDDIPNQRILRYLTLLAHEENIYLPLNISAARRSEINQKNLQYFEQALKDFYPDIIFIWNLHFFDVSLIESVEHTNIKRVYLLSDNWLINFYNSQFIAKYFSQIVHSPSNYLHTILRSIRNSFATIGRETKMIHGFAIFPSTYMQNLYTDAGFKFEEAKIIYHGVSSLKTATPRIDRENLIAANKLKLLFAGRVVDIKGVHTAIEALALINTALPRLEISLSIVGDTRDQQYLSRLKNLITQLHLEDQVCFSPPIPEQELFSLFQDYDIYLFPSLYEPFSLTLIHALQAGIPTIASTAGGNIEIILDQKTGLLFRQSDAKHLARQVIKLAHNPKLRASLGRQAQTYADQFTFERMIEQVEAHLKYLSESNKSL